MNLAASALDHRSYGPATETLQVLLGAIDAFQWFPATDDGQHRVRADRLITEHLAQLQQLESEIQPRRAVETAWLEGSLHDFDQAAQGRYDPEIWGDPWLDDHPWGAALGHASAVVRARIEQTPTLLARIQPPLWPKAGLVNVVQPIIFDPPPPPEFRAEPRWAMMSHVQANLWRAFDWAVAFDGDLSASPFHSLFELHRLGYYPIGFDEHRFVVFRRSREVAA